MLSFNIFPAQNVEPTIHEADNHRSWGCSPCCLRLLDISSDWSECRGEGREADEKHVRNLTCFLPHSSIRSARGGEKYNEREGLPAATRKPIKRAKRKPMGRDNSCHLPLWG